jgi:hypothetical protein
VKDYEIPKFYAYYMATIKRFYEKVLGLPDEKLRFLEKGGD